MSLPESPAARLIASYADASRAWKDGAWRIRRIAELDQEIAGALDGVLLRLQELILEANALFGLHVKMDEMYRNYWYVLNGDFSEIQEQSLIDDYRSWEADSDEILGDIALFESKGRQVEGAEEFRQNTRKAREFLEDQAIREEAERMMPSLEKLDALAEAHLRSIGR